MSYQLRMVAHFFFHSKFLFLLSVYYFSELFSIQLIQFHFNFNAKMVKLSIFIPLKCIFCAVQSQTLAHPMTLFVEQTVEKCSFFFRNTENARTIESHNKFHILQDAHTHLFWSMCFMHSPGVMTKQNYACFLIFPHTSYGHYAVFPRPQ